MNKVLLWVNGILVGLVIVLGFLAVQSQAQPLGATSNFSGPINSDTGYQESGTLIIQSDGAFIGTDRGTINTTTSVTIGTAGETVELISCSTASYNVGALAQNATAAIPFTTTGMSTTSNQVYWFGNNTSSVGFLHLSFVGFVASSTADAGSAIVENVGSGALTSATNTYSLCILQF